MKEKQGRTGSLLFVTVRHEYLQDGEVALEEEQDIVYRVVTKAVVGEGDPLPDAEWSEEIHASPTMLFRYSAVTFNSHKIHYDWRYVTEVWGYSRARGARPSHGHAGDARVLQVCPGFCRPIIRVPRRHAPDNRRRADCGRTCE